MENVSMVALFDFILLWLFYRSRRQNPHYWDCHPKVLDFAGFCSLIGVLYLIGVIVCYLIKG